MLGNNQSNLNNITPSLGEGAYVIIVAGGSGTRMKSELPKQFIELLGKPILFYTIEKFKLTIPSIQIILVLPAAHVSLWESLCKKHDFTIPHQIVEGGATRFHSVKNGLQHVPDNCVVGIHDAVRPLVGETTIINTFKTAREKGNACPAIPLNESIRKIENDNNKAVDRNNYLIIQTPQCFQSKLIKHAFLQNYNPAFTDDATVLESTGEKINLVDGNHENIKITTPQDLLIAKTFLSGE